MDPLIVAASPAEVPPILRELPVWDTSDNRFVAAALAAIRSEPPVAPVPPLVIASCCPAVVTHCP